MILPLLAEKINLGLTQACIICQQKHNNQSSFVCSQIQIDVHLQSVMPDMSAIENKYVSAAPCTQTLWSAHSSSYRAAMHALSHG
jgi:hypothetical protein